MLKQILVGVDTSDEAVDAIAFAHYLARRTGANVKALSAYPFGGVPPSDREAALKQDSEVSFRMVREALKDVPVTTEAVCDSSAARALTRAAEETGADLIVVGSTHRSALGRVFPGSVGDRLLHGAPCPVAVTPRGYSRRRHAGVGLIGVGYLDTPESRLALAEAKELAADLDAAVRIIGVFDLLGRGAGLSVSGYRKVAKGEVNAGLEAAGELIGTEIEHQEVLLEGDPALVLAEQGVELDLLVVGSRGYGPVGRTLLGGVSAKVVRSSPCPVVAVPRGAATVEEPTQERANSRASTT